MELDDIIKQLDKTLIITTKELNGEDLIICCERPKQEMKCPHCNQSSESIHSFYIRKISDLPIQNYKVKLFLKVNKYFCSNDKCEYKTFAENFDFVNRSAVRTKRLDNYINDIGLKNSSIDAKKTIGKTHVNISHHTVLRIVKKKKK